MGRASGFPGIDVKTSASTYSATAYPKTPIYLNKLVYDAITGGANLAGPSGGDMLGRGYL